MRKGIVIDIETGADEAYLDTLRGQTRPCRYDNMIVSGNVKKAESIDNWKQEKLDDQDEKAAISPLLGRIRCIGVGDMATEEVRVIADEGEGEEFTLGAFVDFIDTFHEAPLFTGWRIRGFDLPFIAFRCASWGIRLPAWWPTRFDRFSVFDAWDWVSDMPGPACASGGYRLPVWLQRFGAPAKTGDGDDAPGMPLDQLVEYCRGDVIAERDMIRKIACAVPLLQDLQTWGEQRHG